MSPGTRALPLRMPIEPMLAAAVDQLPTGRAMRGGCWYEVKLDGYRGLVFVAADQARVQSRGRHDITRAFPDVAAAAHAALPAGTVVDGELVVWSDGALDFSALQTRMARSQGRRRTLPLGPPANYMIFDVLAFAGRDVRTLPLRERRAVLEDALDGVGPPLQLVPYTRDVDQARAWLEAYARTRVGIEGVVIKGVESRYESGKRGWAKLRIRDTTEAVVGAVTGSLTSPTRLVLGFHDPTGRLIIAGATTDLSVGQRLDVAPYLRAATQGHPWPSVIGPGRFGNWGGDPQPVRLVEPHLVVEVSGDTSVKDGRWRHAVRFVRTRPDLEAGDVTGPS